MSKIVDEWVARLKGKLPPVGDMTESQARAWVDDKDRAINSMRLAGGRVIRQYDRCRNRAGS